MAIINTETVIACGLSIDIYPSFDPAQVIICPYVSIDKDKIQLIYMNISFETNDQIVIYSDPQIISSPEYFIKLQNNSFISPLNLNQTSTYYLPFSSELTCRFSFEINETICFYYPISSNFIHIEHQYDEIKHGSLILSETLRNRFYISFIIIIILIIMICFSAIYIVSTNRSPFFQITEFDLIIDRQEAARRPADPLQDGPVAHPILAEHLTSKDAEGTTGDM